MKISNKQKKKDIKVLNSICMIVAGTIVLAFGMYNFNLQDDITEGGTLGIILLIKNIYNISPSITNIIVDFTIFIIGSKFFGKKFLLYSMFASLSFSGFYYIFEKIGFLVRNLQGHMIIASILAGIFVGTGVGLVVRGGGASGGDDVFALLGRRFFNIKIRYIYLISDMTILLISLTYLSLRQVLFSIISVIISGNLVDFTAQYKNKLFKVSKR